MYEAKINRFQQIFWMRLTTVVLIFMHLHVGIDPEAIYIFEPKNTMHIVDEQLKIVIPKVYAPSNSN